MKHARAWVGFGVLSFAVAVATVCCGGSTGPVTGGQQPTSGDGAPGQPPPGAGPPPAALGAPAVHRDVASMCPDTRGAGVTSDAGGPDAGFPGECASDADCTQGKNGRCLPPQGNLRADLCSYDDCANDADCPGGKVCTCGTPIGQNGSDGTPIRTGNRCVPANCHLDADCGAGGFCSPTVDTTCGSRSGIVGYYCHTPSDECVKDDQCTDGGLPGYCAYDPMKAHWVCEYGFCAG
jgi:hypothetical protein